MPSIDNTLLESALKIAIKAHEGQTDKAGKAYILHPLRIASNCSTIETQIVALLHDVVEDSSITLEDLKTSGFPDTIIDAIDSVTRRRNESYMDFVCRCSKNPIGKAVKLLDLDDNMNIKRLSKISEADIKRLNKYKVAYDYLKCL